MWSSWQTIVGIEKTASHILDVFMCRDQLCLLTELPSLFKDLWSSLLIDAFSSRFHFAEKKFSIS